MNAKIAPDKEPQSLLILSLFAFLELLASGLVTLLINPDPKNALLFGFSALRLLLVAGIWALAIIVLVAGGMARRQKWSLDSAFLRNKGKNLRRLIYAASFILILWGWLALVCPAYLFGKLIYFFERIQPFSVALGVVLAQSWLFFLFARGRLGFRAPGKAAVQKYYRPSLLIAIVMIVLGIFIAATKFGLLASLIYSNVPGIPVSGLQFFSILLLAGLWIAFVPNQEHARPFWRIVNRYRLIPILIFIIAALVWGLTPMIRHFFSLPPAAPSYQPFPYSDARTYDLGAISILRGYGISYYGLPFYSIILAILHFFAGSDYVLLTWLQILILAFIPVILFLLGEKFHSTAFGIFLAGVMILRQRNAIVLSYKVSSVNPKLFMTEEMTLLAVVLLAYLVFMWMRDRKIWQALLCGGCIGTASLIRLNPLFLFPAVACLIVLAFWRMGRKSLLGHLSIYTLAFLLLIIPWMLSSVDSEGRSWLSVKLQSVINQRYDRSGPILQGNAGSSLPDTGFKAVKSDGDAVSTLQTEGAQAPVIDQNAQKILAQNSGDLLVKGDADNRGVIYRVFYHLLHNFSTSVMSLPDSLLYDDVDHLSQRNYWSDTGEWQGRLPWIQVILIFLNLILVAIGLGYSWVHHRWAGLIPLAIFIAYSVSLGLAMNSGGRYLVPMDWVLYYYYGLAIIVIIKFVQHVSAPVEQSQPVGPEPVPVWQVSDRSKLGFSLAGIIFLASLIPIAGFVLPVLTSSNRNNVDIETARGSISARVDPGANIVYGEILYPYTEGDILKFDFLTPTGVASYSILRTPALKSGLRGGERAFITLRNDNKKNLQVESIYRWRDVNPEPIWENQP